MDSCHGTFREDSWTLLSFPTDSPVLAVLPCSKCTSQKRLIKSSSPGSFKRWLLCLLASILAADTRVLLFVWWILLLQACKLAFDLRPPICFPERDYKQDKYHTNSLCIIPDKSQLSKPMNYMRRG